MHVPVGQPGTRIPAAISASEVTRPAHGAQPMLGSREDGMRATV